MSNEPNAICALEPAHEDMGIFQKRIGDLRIYQCAECSTVFDEHGRIRASLDKP